MKFLGNFGPTVNVENRQIKGYMLDPDDGEAGKVYLDSRELIELANACIEMAHWLDARASDSAGEKHGST
jgi:hypothetical protein